MTHLVVADTGPLRYLIQIGHIEILPSIFRKIVIPTAVLAELLHMSAPEPVRRWAEAPPTWLEVLPVTVDDAIADLQTLDDGERAAIALGQFLRAKIILIDDRRGAAMARKRGSRLSELWAF